MKVSVLVIAYNEEPYIGACLDALTQQTQVPDEIVLVAHNCTDRTVEIARQYPAVRVVELAGPPGTIYARIKGFEEVRGDLVLCTDGDTVVPARWVEKLVAAFKHPRIVGTAGAVQFTGPGGRSALNTFIEFPLTWLFGRVLPVVRAWPFWGASFAVRREAYERAGGLLPLLAIRDQLALATCPDDFYLANMLLTQGTIAYVPGICVQSVAKVTSHVADHARARVQQREGWRLYRFLQRQR